MNGIVKIRMVTIMGVFHHYINIVYHQVQLGLYGMVLTAMVVIVMMMCVIVQMVYSMNVEYVLV
jgi:hypothetical protein